MNFTSMTGNVSTKDLIAAEEAARSLVIQRYQPTLIVVTVLLVFLSLFGFIGNALVIYTIGRRKMPGLFGCITKCFQTVGHWLCCGQCRQRGTMQSVNPNAKTNEHKSFNSFINSFKRIPWLQTQSIRMQPGNSQDFHGETSVTNMSQDETKRCSVKFLQRPAINRMSSTGGYNSNSLILLLAFNDFIICTFDIPATIKLIIWEQGTLDFVCRLHVLLKTLMLSVSALLLLLIAVDRWLIVCFVPSVRIPRRTLYLCVVLCYVSGFGWAVPMGLRHGVPTRFEVRAVDQLIRPTHEFNTSASELLHFQTSFEDSVTETDYFLPEHETRSNEEDSLLKAITNFGTCQVDDRFISRSNYRYYQLAVLIFFIVIFTLISFIYGLIFTFIWCHQRRWYSKFTFQSTEETPMNPENSQRPVSVREIKYIPSSTDSILQEVNNQKYSNVSNVQQGIFDCAEMKKTSPEFMKFKSQMEQSLCDENCQIQNNLVTTLGQSRISSGSTDVMNTNNQFSSVVDSVQLAGMQPERQNASQTGKMIRNNERKARRTERKHKLRDSLRNRSARHRQVKSANRHLRTAVMFILITVTFLVSYLPSLLISNGLMWKVEWETVDGVESGILSYYEEPSSIVPTATMTIPEDVEPTQSDHYSQITKMQRIGYHGLRPSHIFVRSEVTHHFRRLLFFLYFINTVTNPLIYFFLNLKFRGELKQLFRRNYPTHRVDD